MSLTGEIPFTVKSLFFGVGTLDYSLIDTTAETTISLISAGLGVGINLEPSLKLSLNLLLQPAGVSVFIRG